MSAPEGNQRRYRPRLRAVSVLRCAFWLSAVHVGIKTRGFMTVWRFVNKQRRPQEPYTEEDKAYVDGVASDMAVAAALYPFRARCLHQSIALYYLLRRQGIEVEHRIGVQPYRFRAHAWIEFRGRPINERGSEITGLVVLPSVPI
jgi:hypothetical protein